MKDYFSESPRSALKLFFLRLLDLSGEPGWYLSGFESAEDHENWCNRKRERVRHWNELRRIDAEEKARQGKLSSGPCINPFGCP